MNKPKVNMAEVAKTAGVSISTVSRVINGNTFVSENKRLAVNQALQDLEFQPNYFAKSLITGKSMTIGLVALEIVSPYYSEIIWGFEHGLLDTNYHPIVRSSKWFKNKETEAIETLISQKVDGLVILGTNLPESTILEFYKRIPLLILGRSIPAISNCCLALDQHQAAYLATRHLIGLGHRDIAFICGPSDQIDAQRRLDGYCNAIKDANMDVRKDLIIEGDFSEITAYQNVTNFLENQHLFTALFAANDQMAAGARLALHRKGLRVPDDISLIGFDDLPGNAFSTPPLTTIRQPTYQIGQALATSIVDVLEGRHLILPSFELKLHIRESTRMLHKFKQ